MKIISWNVNGLKACLKKGFGEYAAACGADILLLQETKVASGNLPPLLQNYNAAWNFAERKGYSGTLCLFHNEPVSIKHGMGNPSLDREGRLITLEYPEYYVVNVYVPNSQANLARKYYRMDWDRAFREYVCRLQDDMPVIIGGDFNVARDYIDIYPENLRNEKNLPGFTADERDGLEQLIRSGFIDVFRWFYPHREGAYSWWSTRLNKRQENRGWRIDYFLVSEGLIPKLESMTIRDDIFGSDHCPIELMMSCS